MLVEHCFFFFRVLCIVCFFPVRWFKSYWHAWSVEWLLVGVQVLSIVMWIADSEYAKFRLKDILNVWMWPMRWNNFVAVYRWNSILAASFSVEKRVLYQHSYGSNPSRQVTHPPKWRNLLALFSLMRLPKSIELLLHNPNKWWKPRNSASHIISMKLIDFSGDQIFFWKNHISQGLAAVFFLLLVKKYNFSTICSNNCFLFQLYLIHAGLILWHASIINCFGIERPLFLCLFICVWRKMVYSRILSEAHAIILAPWWLKKTNHFSYLEN